MTAPSENDGWDLSDKYRSLLKSIKPFVQNLRNSLDAKLCLLWLAKLDEAKDNEKKIRNELLEKLRENVIKNKLEYPFNENPPQGSLAKNFSNIKTSERSVTVSVSNRANPSAQESSQSDDNLSVLREAQKYRNKTRAHKVAIVKYQHILRDLLNSTISTKKVNPSHLIETLNHCDCQLQNDATRGGDQQQSIKTLIQRIERLEEGNNSLTRRCNNLETLIEEYTQKNLSKEPDGLSNSEKKVKKERDQSLKTNEYSRETLYEFFNKEISNVITEKDKKIADLVTKIQNLEDESRAMIDDINEKMTGKCDNLENKYKRLFLELSEDFERRKKDDQKKIQQLQKGLFSTNINFTSRP